MVSFRCLSATEIKFCKYVICSSLPFLLLPLAISASKEYRCAYVAILLAVYWILEPVHIAGTSLLPIFLFPLLGIMDSKEVCSYYMLEGVVVFVGGYFIAIAFENCGLHERIALKVLLLIGTDLKRLMAGFMFVTMLFSMWISNTACAAMMVPIIEAIVSRITDQQTSADDGELKAINETETEISQEAKNHEFQRNSGTKQNPIKFILLTCLLYSANIGGTGTLLGTYGNLIFKGIIEDLYPEFKEITFATWMMYNIPCMLLCVFAGWLFLCVIYIGRKPYNTQCSKSIRETIVRQYQSLGSISFSEGTVFVLFLLVVFLWIFRDPKFIAGWNDLFPHTNVGNSTPPMLAVFLMLMIPSNFRQWKTSPPILKWKTLQDKFPWGLLFLVGAGISLAAGSRKSGLSELVGNKMLSLSTLSPIIILVIMCFLAAMVTEVITNAVTITIFLPILNQMAIGMRINPLYLMLPVTVTCSYAFMLPIATGSNAVIFEIGGLKMTQMVKPGFGMNILCCSIQILMINTLGTAMFNLNEFPAWADNKTSSMELNDFTSNNISDIFHSTNATF